MTKFIWPLLNCKEFASTIDELKSKPAKLIYCSESEPKASNDYSGAVSSYVKTLILKR